MTCSQRISRQSFAQLRARLIQHDKCEPSPPQGCGMAVMSDVSPAAIADYANKHSIKNLGIFTDEGDEFFSRGAKHDPTIFNQSWSGQKNKRHRVSSGDQSTDMAIAMGVSMQPEVADKAFTGQSKKLRRSGFAARALFAFPPSNQGFRSPNTILRDDARDERYRKRVHELLELNLDQKGSESRMVLSFSPEAKQHWFRLQCEIEIEIRPGGRYSEFRDHASKLADNAARVAGVLHTMEYGPEGNISLATLSQAIEVCLYCSEQFMRLFREPPQEEVDLAKLGKWISDKRQAGHRYIKKSLVLTHGPLRPAGRLDIALATLDAQKVIGIWVFPRVTISGRPTKSTKIIDLLPHMAPDQYAMQQVANAY